VSLCCYADLSRHSVPSVANTFFNKISARMAQKFGRWVKIQPLSKNSIFDSISSKYYYIFETLPVPKFLKTPDFFNVSYGKNTRNKTVLIFGPFSAISGKILPKFCHRFVRPLGPFCVMQPKNQPVGNTANWRNSSGNSLQVSILLLLPPPSPPSPLSPHIFAWYKYLSWEGNM